MGSPEATHVRTTATAFSLGQDPNNMPLIVFKVLGLPEADEGPVLIEQMGVDMQMTTGFTRPETHGTRCGSSERRAILFETSPLQPFHLKLAEHRR